MPEPEVARQRPAERPQASARRKYEGLAGGGCVNSRAVQWPFDYAVAMIVAMVLIAVLAYNEWVERHP